MLRVLFMVVVLNCPLFPVQASDLPNVAPRPLASALHAVRADRWEDAARLAARDGPAATTMIAWLRLRAGLGKPREINDFLARHPDWPGLRYLRKQSEKAMADADVDTVRAFYAGHPPQTGVGVLSYARALIARGQEGEAEATVVLAWRTMDLTTEEHHAFLASYEKLLKPHHAARLEMALWRGLRDVKQMLPLVPDDQRKLAETRQLIEHGRRGLDTLIAELPAKVRADPGVAHALFNRMIRRDETDKAIALIRKQSQVPGGLGEPQQWAGWRRVLARAQMREGKIQVAYDLAAHHQLVEGASYADLEWLSGYLALIYMKDPGLALDHFQRFRAAVKTPISLGRAGYWIGRALAASGDAEAAQDAYRQGAKYSTSFYGLLAAEKAKIKIKTNSYNFSTLPSWRASGFASSDVFQAGVLALAAGRLSLAEQFFVHLSGRLNAADLAQLGAALGELQQPHLQVMIGKAAAGRGIVVPAPYYPLHPLADNDLPVPAELALAIARRESEFDASVVSGAGAQGLMQLMPGTARDTARALGLVHDAGKVLTDWHYNARLGAAYLAHLSERFDGNIIMIAAGYNAGPNRPPRWMGQFGDPRGGGEAEIVNWIEHIPFRETRNYVMRVAESLPVYRARLGKPPLPIPFSAEIAGSSMRVARE